MPPPSEPTPALDPRVRDRIDSWLEWDPAPAERDELARLVAAGAHDELADRFAGDLAFGTAGIRAPMGAGSNRMNRAAVRRVAAGLARSTGAGARVVVGHDARHRSPEFATEVAAVLAAGGIEVHRLADPCPTPLVAFAVDHLAAAAGVMVTASHNPPADNGLKIYGADGAQLGPPEDALLLGAVAEATPPVPPAGSAAAVQMVGPDLVDAYVAAAVASCPDGPRDVRVAYSALHGVGAPLVGAALEAAGFEPPVMVEDECRPDPDFGGLAFPNPEETAAMAASLARARTALADVALATDPDADRLGVAVPTRDGEWRQLTGDEVGALLADHLLERGAGPDRLVVTTFVSSPLVGALARSVGVHHVETLTGFKWIVRPALAHPEWRWVLGYEEALGYAVSSAVRDKDGITAALAVAALVAALRAGGTSVEERLDDLALRHGLHLSRTWSRRDDTAGGGARLRAGYEALCRRPPDELAGRAVTAVVDHRDRVGPLPPTDALRLELGEDLAVILRPSGTEPKVKAYMHRRVDVSEPALLAAARRRVGDELASLAGAVATALDAALAGGGGDGVDPPRDSGPV